MINLSRLGFLRAFFVGAFVPILYPLLNLLGDKSRRRKSPLRPPGAKPEREFLRDCIACGQCANVCPNKCITLLGIDNGIENLGTPKIDARAQACILCMACTQVCPTQALEKLEPTPEGIQAVNMGLAFVSEDLCYSFAGRTCGVCYRACPLPGKGYDSWPFRTTSRSRRALYRMRSVRTGLCQNAPGNSSRANG